jgi:O-antigen/teichoic acid export membrane protein
VSGTTDPEGRPVPGDPDGPGLETILEEIETVVEPVTESVAMAPAVGIAVAGGPMITLPDEGPTEPETAADAASAAAADGPTDGAADGATGGAADAARGAGAGEKGPRPGAGADATTGDSVVSGLSQAGPVAVAGMIVNGAGALVVVVVARLVTPQSYGAIAQLLGLFFILSMPGSAVLVGVVRRVTALQRAGHGQMVRQWVVRLRRLLLGAIVVGAIVVLALQGWIARQLGLPNSEGVALILVSGGIWILLSVDRGLLQAHRSYRALAGNLLVEGGVRTAFVIGFVSAHLGVAGYALGVFIGETVATIHARWLATRVWSSSADLVAPPAVYDPTADSTLARRRLLADVSAAFVGLALLGLLQNVDVILLGRLDHANVGPYAAISVASKALVFGALALGAYLLPEATIRWNEGGHAIRQLGVTLIFLAVPAAVLLGVSLFAPRWFLTLVFSAKLSSAAPAFATLVVAMMCLSFSVLVTNYLFGTGSRWIVFLLAAGAALATVLVALAGGRTVATARADLAAQAALALAMAVAFVAIHWKHRGSRWLLGPSQRRIAAPAGPVR